MAFENILLMALAVIGIYEGARLAKVALLFDDPVGPGWYLFFLSILLLICAMALILRERRRRSTSPGGGLSVLKGPAGLSLLLLLFYVLAATISGYAIASLIFFVLAQRIFGEKSWTRSGVLGLAMTGTFYFIFSYLAGVPFP